MIEVRLLEKNEEKIYFILKGINAALANTLRRIMINRVPVMAIEDVEFKKNSSVLYDEIIAHRLGLIPLKTDIKSYNLPEECSCKGKRCAKCSLKLILKAKGPKTIYASDLKSKDPKVVPVFPKIPIVKLLDKQKLELEATAVLGVGKVHAKWSPGKVYYKNKVSIEINKNCDKCKKCIEVCPQHIFEIKNDKIIINKDKLLSCHYCEACIDACPKKAIKIHQDPDTFIYTVESWGQLSPQEIALHSLKVFNDMLNEFIKKLKKS